MDKVWSLFDNSIGRISKMLTQERLDKTIAKLESSANIGIPAAILVIVAVGITQSVKNDSSDALEMAAKMSGAVLGFGYLSHRFKEGCRKAGTKARSVLSLQVYLDVLVLGGFLGAVGLFVSGLRLMVDARFNAAAALLVIGFIALLTTWHLCNPKRLGVEIDTEGGADNDIVSLIAITVRLCLRMAAPVASIVVIIATLSLVASVIGYLTFDPTSEANRLMMRYGGNPYSAQMAASMSMIVGGVAIPLGVYLSYALVSFSLAFIENALSVKIIASNTANGGSGRRPPALKLRRPAKAEANAEPEADKDDAPEGDDSEA